MWNRTVCLVRARTPNEGHRRIREKLRALDLWEEPFAARIHVALGDLGETALGLGEAAFAALAGHVHAVYHAGALVNFLVPFAVSERANVFGTAEVLRLVETGAPKPLHHVSTISTFSDPAYAGAVIDETMVPGHESGIEEGYALSKPHAERLVEQARLRGVSATIHRLGRITGHSRTGAASTDDFVCQMLRGCVELGAAPDIAMRIDITPVDYVEVNPKPITLRELIDRMNTHGYPIWHVERRAWAAQVRAQLGRLTRLGISPTLALFDERIADEQARRPDFATARTVAALAPHGVTCPPVDQALIRTYLAWFERTGFFPAPPRAGARTSTREMRLTHAPDPG